MEAVDGDLLLLLARAWAQSMSGQQQAAAVNIKDVKTDGDPFIGKADAPVTIAFWSDFQCPYCKKLEETAGPALVEQAKAGKLNLDDMVTRATGIAQREGFAEAGQRIIITAGLPLGTPGATNMLRISYVGRGGAAGN